MPTAYFSKATFQFLRDLAANNDREWFAANKTPYENVLRKPFLALIADLAGPLAKVSAHYRADARPQGGSLFRIHRDTRFSNDKRPYKTAAGAKLFHERTREIEAPVFYIHIAPGECFFGGGIWHGQPDTVKKVREFLADNPAAWKKAVRGKAFASLFEQGGESLTRPPRGFDPNHELIDDIKRKDFVAHRNFNDAMATSAELHPFLVESIKGLAPMIDYLCAAVELEF